jgi:hypothetical protein
MPSSGPSRGNSWKGAIVQRAELDVVNGGPHKAVHIWNVSGRRPILAAGNSNGDLEMLTFTGGPSLPPLRLLVLHDDAQRDWRSVFIRET